VEKKGGGGSWAGTKEGENFEKKGGDSIYRGGGKREEEKGALGKKTNLRKRSLWGNVKFAAQFVRTAQEREAAAGVEPLKGKKRKNIHWASFGLPSRGKERLEVGTDAKEESKPWGNA